MLGIVPTLALAAAVLAPLAAGQQPQGVASRGAAELVTLTARIEAIDYASRVVAIRGPLGRTLALKVDDRVRNFGKVKAGDEVVVKYAEAVTVALDRVDGGRVETLTPTAPLPVAAGPGATIAQQVRIAASIEALDAARQVILLAASGGRHVEVKVRDAGVFGTLKAGDGVTVTFTEAVVVDVVPPGK
jgi:hypothetical protein